MGFFYPRQSCLLVDQSPYNFNSDPPPSSSPSSSPAIAECNAFFVFIVKSNAFLKAHSILRFKFQMHCVGRFIFQLHWILRQHFRCTEFCHKILDILIIFSSHISNPNYYIQSSSVVIFLLWVLFKMHWVYVMHFSFPS